MPSFDPKQLETLQFNDGSAVVLAAPGCGKTYLLSFRVFYANSSLKVPFSEMLCLTFTNRASREMKDRIRDMAKTAADVVLSELFVGNLHRFCIRFLFENQIVPINTSIIDDTDQEEIINYIGRGSITKAWQVNETLRRSYYFLSQEYRLPQEITEMYGMDSRFDSWAKEYNKYKKEEQVIDFEDILLLTYKALCEDGYQSKYKYSSFRWIEIDEVQDLNPLQLAIIEKLRPQHDKGTIVYFGDERQAIFSFIGAKDNSIQNLIKTTDKTIYLSKNYRSPMYLLDLLNDYAISVLKIDSDKLPKTENNTQLDDSLVSVKCIDNSEQYQVLAMLTRLLNARSEEKEYTGILVRTNDEVEKISEVLSQYNLSHIRLSKKDMFKSLPFKTLYSHFSVISAETRYQDWIQLLFRTKALKSLDLSRRFMRKMKELCLTPHDLMYYYNSSYFIEFEASYRGKEIVIFDTETTGTNIFEDDIIQIAAIKVLNGRIVPNSEFDIIIETDKTIPRFLNGGLENPMVSVYNNRSHFTAQQGFSLFLNYLGQDELLGHNVSFDVNMLANNIDRRTTGLSFAKPSSWDSLKISRLINPNLRSHALKDLLEVYRLEGRNTHNALDDIFATKSLIDYFYPIVRSKADEQKAFILHPATQEVRYNLLENYKPIYEHTKSKLFAKELGEEYSFTYEFEYVYNVFRRNKYIDEISLFSYMKDLFQKVVIDEQKDIYFNQQLLNHLYEFRTFNEADLFQNKIIDENVFIMTIHKAKGLEFDNVLLYNISDGVYPNGTFDNTPKKVLESAKVLYVAMSRAKKRLYFSYMKNKSRFLQIDCVAEHFEEYPEPLKRRLVEMTEMQKK